MKTIKKAVMRPVSARLKQRRKPLGYRPLLQIDTNAKTSKGRKLGYMTGILYLAPADTVPGLNLCPRSTPGCRAGCLYGAGRAAIMPSIGKARIAKTIFMRDHRELFLACLRYDLESLRRKAEKAGLKPAARINGTSDLAWIPLGVSAEFPDIDFYDYTKLDKPWIRERANYHLTFSHSESNHSECIEALAHGMNVAVVFQTKEFPHEFLGRPVISGDNHDLRFLDPRNSSAGYVIALYAKGPAKKDTSGFVILQ